MKCCICNKEITGMGNNPAGCIDETKKLIQWNDEDRCCDDCNKQYVVPGRFYRFYHVIKNESLVKRGN